MKFTITTNDGDILLRRNLTRFADSLTDFRQIGAGLVPALRSLMRSQFAAQGNGASGAWKPLSKSYAAWKAKKFPGRPILQRTGATFRALTQETDETIKSIRKDSITFGVRLPYPIFHQRGGGKLPRRPIFDFNETQKRELVRVVQRRILKGGRENGVTLS